jgi:2-keto-4-pentenoate hydratase
MTAKNRDTSVQTYAPPITKEITQAAEILHAARETRVPCAPVRDLLAPGDIQSAYSVQALNIERRLKTGQLISGCKIGLTSRAVQQQLGIAECDTGVLFADDIFREDQDIPAASVMQPMVEGEIAIVLERDIEQERPTVSDIIRATAFCLPTIEIVDSRIRNWDIKIQDTIADNASSQFIVAGGHPVLLRDLDFELCGMTMSRNGEMVSVGVGAACLGNPLNAAAWLARKRIELGMPLKAGTIVLTGALGPFAKATPGDRFEVRIAGLGSVRTHFAQH